MAGNDSLLRSDREIALQDVTEACAAARDLHRHLAELAEGTLASRLDGLAEEREAWCRRLDGMIRDLGHLPRKPDPDWEALRDLGSTLQTIVASEAERVLLGRAREAEEQLASKLRGALAFDLPDAAASLLADTLSAVEREIQGLVR